MLDDLAFDRRDPFGTLPPEAPLPMPTQVIERRRTSPGGGWLRRLLRAAG